MSVGCVRLCFVISVCGMCVLNVLNGVSICVLCVNSFFKPMLKPTPEQCEINSRARVNTIPH